MKKYVSCVSWISHWIVFIYVGCKTGIRWIRRECEKSTWKSRHLYPIWKWTLRRKTQSIRYRWNCCGPIYRYFIEIINSQFSTTDTSKDIHYDKSIFIETGFVDIDYSLTILWRITHYCVFENYIFLKILLCIVSNKHFSKLNINSRVNTLECLGNFERMLPRHW